MTTNDEPALGTRVEGLLVREPAVLARLDRCERALRWWCIATVLVCLISAMTLFLTLRPRDKSRPMTFHSGEGELEISGSSLVLRSGSKTTRLSASGLRVDGGTRTSS